ncbi:NAD(+)/NADH kinase [Halorhabdus sp. CUG00001]|uniref:NAD(+)/NADH kinase n=1 Tax=Halorhabdus sp. CUG00001 TaxID=2600297 RepID=UPI00131CE893|nr:NAD(+)/NADH kinase [Halorhabdus sp. CUG00001]
MSPEPRNGPVAVVGDDGGAVVELVESMGLRTVSGEPTDHEEATVAIAIGEPALFEVAREWPTTPILPVDVSAGHQAVPPGALQSALGHLADGTYTIQNQPLLSVTLDGDPVGTAVSDVMLVTAEPAHISEYTVERPAESISTFRADGVVVATPAGSAGYARQVGGPILSPDVAALSVVPIGAFKTERDHWVVSVPEETWALKLSVEREEAPVSLLVDGHDTRRVAADEQLTLAHGGVISLMSVPESESVYRPLGDRPHTTRTVDDRGSTDFASSPETQSSEESARLPDASFPRE